MLFRAALIFVDSIVVKCTSHQNLPIFPPSALIGRSILEKYGLFCFIYFFMHKNCKVPIFLSTYLLINSLYFDALSTLSFIIKSLIMQDQVHLKKLEHHHKVNVFQ